MKMLQKRRGSGAINVSVLVLCAMMIVALGMRVVPVYIAKSRLDTFAAELIREAEIAGRVGSETTLRASVLKDKTGLNPTIKWSKTGKIQLNSEISVTLNIQMNVGLFGGFGSFPVTLSSTASGKSERYWK